MRHHGRIVRIGYMEAEVTRGGGPCVVCGADSHVIVAYVLISRRSNKYAVREAKPSRQRAAVGELRRKHEGVLRIDVGKGALANFESETLVLGGDLVGKRGLPDWRIVHIGDG